MYNFAYSSAEYDENSATLPYGVDYSTLSLHDGGMYGENPEQDLPSQTPMHPSSLHHSTSRLSAQHTATSAPAAALEAATQVQEQGKSCYNAFFGGIRNCLCPPHPRRARGLAYAPTDSNFNVDQYDTTQTNISQRSVIKWYNNIRSNWVTKLNHPQKFAQNVVKNTKYSILTFIPLFLYNEFRFFFNLYFLIVALTQFIPELRVGYLFTYVAPLSIVLFISMCKELYDDFQRFLRDREANTALVKVYIPTYEQSLTQQQDNNNNNNDMNYNNMSQEIHSFQQRHHLQQTKILTSQTSNINNNNNDHYHSEDIDTIATISVPSSLLQPGDIILLDPQQRVPCDCLLLKAFDKSGTVFLKTDQLDGETDWKLRRPPTCTQQRLWSRNASQITQGDFTIEAEAPHLDIYDFKGKIELFKNGLQDRVFQGHTLDTTTFASSSTTTTTSTTTSTTTNEPIVEGLSLENTLWATTTVASSAVLAMVLYTGKDTRSTLNANQPRTKTGALDNEVNRLSKLLFILTIILAFVMTCLKGLHGIWYIYFFRFILLFSSIIPISLRVNLDMAKMLYSYQINNDRSIHDTVVRTSTIPEELGRISYIFTDKTGTLTTNTMSFKVLQMAPPLLYNNDTIESLKYHLAASFANETGTNNNTLSSKSPQATNNNIPAVAYPSSPNDLYTDENGLLGYDLDDDTFDASIATTTSTTTATATATASSNQSMTSSTQQPTRRPIPQNISTRQRQGGTQPYSIPGISAIEMQNQTRLFMEAIVLCHNVTPTETSDDISTTHTTIEQTQSPTNLTSLQTSQSTDSLTQHTSPSLWSHIPGSSGIRHSDEHHHSSGIQLSNMQQQQQQQHTVITSEEVVTKYQASSPDEVALVSFADQMGLTLTQRDTSSMEFTTPQGVTIKYEILAVFPFTSASKRMGIIVRHPNGDILYYVKGAESIIIPKCVPNSWVSEEVSNLARIGLRTLVFAYTKLTPGRYTAFDKQLNQAKASLLDRDEAIQDAILSLEVDLHCIGITGVEDKLQDNIRHTLEILRNSGIKIWMLTGDKNETAACIGLSTRLVERSQPIITMACTNKREALATLDNASRNTSTSCLLVDGPSLQVLLDTYPNEFLEVACTAPSVICCRCSPTQKAQVVTLMKNFTKMRCLAIGDGGNDVAMIQAAHVGVGIVGKEGQQAAMSADFSVVQFSFLSTLLLWHGRNAYKRSASLAQFIMHRGIIISIIQAVFSALFFFVAVPIFTGWLMVGYTTIYTMLPVFSLVLDTDVDRKTAFTYPELYKALQNGTPLGTRTFFIWVLLSVYQGGIIMLLGIMLFNQSFVNIVSISFTALISVELLNVVMNIKNWVIWMVWALALSVVAYVISIFALTTYFDITFVVSWEFLWKVALIVCVAAFPPMFVKAIATQLNPSEHLKVRQYS